MSIQNLDYPFIFYRLMHKILEDFASHLTCNWFHQEVFVVDRVYIGTVPCKRTSCCDHCIQVAPGLHRIWLPRLGAPFTYKTANSRLGKVGFVPYTYNLVRMYSLYKLYYDTELNRAGIVNVQGGWCFRSDNKFLSGWICFLKA